MTPLARLWKHHRIALLLFGLTLGLTLFFAVRMAVFTIYWSDPVHRNLEPEGWMTPGFVAHSWDLPPGTVAEALKLDPDGTPRRITLEELAEERGQPLSDLLSDVTAIIEAAREGGPDPVE